MNGRSLHDIWIANRAVLMSDGREAYELARKANGEGESLLAVEIAETVLDALPASDRIPLLQQRALALARSGSTLEALATLKTLRAVGAEDGETFGLMGRVYKDLAAGAADSTERRKFLVESQQLYQLGFERSGATYCGINAAAQAVLLDDLELAKRLAEQTLAQVPEVNDYWALATRAEATLILKPGEEAGNLYRRACEVFGGRWGDLASTRRQCRALCMKLYGRRDQLDSCFPAGAVAVFAGHVIDAPGREKPRFPESSEDSVKKRIAEWLAASAIRFSFSSAACGADLVFLSAAREAGVETHLVLPFAAPEFLETSVRCGGQRWIARFEEAMEKSASTTILNDEVADDKSSAFDFTNRMVAAKAALRAAALDLPVKALAVWDILPAGGRGGTADAVACWSNAKIAIHVIHPLEPCKDGPASEETATPAVPFEGTQTALPTGHRTFVCAIMHLFFANYFGLRENQYSIFQRTVLDTLAKLLMTTSFPPVSRYGFGPDYVFVFNAMRAAGMCASDLLDGLKRALAGTADLEMDPPRICLHAGPVQMMVNPVLNQYSHEGATLTRAGRIVRILKPGSVYCTETFAAISALEAIREFQFEYAGTSKYHAGNGQDRLFSVRFR